jgi:hypothetical protein
MPTKFQIATLTTAAPREEQGGEPDAPLQTGASMCAGQQLIYEDRAHSSELVDVVLVMVDPSALPPEQEHTRSYTVWMPDGRERNTLAERLQVPPPRHTHTHTHNHTTMSSGP